jgi:hypothetical protein
MLLRISNSRAPYRGGSKTRNCASRINLDRSVGISTLNVDSCAANYLCIRLTTGKAHLTPRLPAFDKVLTIIGPKDTQSVLVQKLLSPTLTCGAVGGGPRTMADNGRKDLTDRCVTTGGPRKVPVAQNLGHRGCDLDHVFVLANRTLPARSRQRAVSQDWSRMHKRNSRGYDSGYVD